MELPLVIHGVYLSVSGSTVTAEVMKSEHLVALAHHPPGPALREVSINSSVQIWVAAATADAVVVNCCCTGAAVFRAAVSGVRLLSVTSSTLLMYVAANGGAELRLWREGFADVQVFGAEANVTAVALYEEDFVATQAYVGVPDGVVLTFSVVFGACEWAPAFVLPTGSVTSILPVKGGAVAVSGGGTAAAAIHVHSGRLTTAAAPFATRVVSAGYGSPWALRSDGAAWQLGAPGRLVKAPRGVYVGRSGRVVACGPGGVFLYSD